MCCVEGCLQLCAQLQRGTEVFLLDQVAGRYQLRELAVAEETLPEVVGEAFADGLDFAGTG